MAEAIHKEKSQEPKQEKAPTPQEVRAKQLKDQEAERKRLDEQIKTLEASENELGRRVAPVSVADGPEFHRMQEVKAELGRTQEALKKARKDRAALPDPRGQVDRKTDALLKASEGDLREALRLQREELLKKCTPEELEEELVRRGLPPA